MSNTVCLLVAVIVAAACVGGIPIDNQVELATFEMIQQIHEMLPEFTYEELSQMSLSEVAKILDGPVTPEDIEDDKLAKAFLDPNFGFVPTGFAALQICSAIFVAGIDEDTATREDGSGPALFCNITVDYVNQTVVATILPRFGIAQSYKAIFRGPTIGCALVDGRSGLTEADIRGQDTGLHTPIPLRNTSQPWPLGDGPPEPFPPEVNEQCVRDVIQDDFRRPLFRTRATVIVYRGRLIFERYKTVNVRTPLMGWSMSKSITGALMGMLINEGRIGLHDQADIDQWQGARPKNITYHNMLQMSSGILWTESIHLVLCLFVDVDCANYYSELPEAYAPGTRFLYSSGNSYTLGFLVEKMRGQREINTYDWPRERLFRPMGMDNAVFEFVPHGYIAGGSMSYLNARDWARFGLLYYNRGNWFGNQLVPEWWVDYSCEQSAQSNWAYGAQWWRLYDHDPDGCYASGFRKQAVIVLPNRNLVIGRNAMPPLSLVWLWSQQEYLNRLLVCFPPLEEEMAWNAANKKAKQA